MNILSVLLEEKMYTKKLCTKIELLLEIKFIHEKGI